MMLRTTRVLADRLISLSASLGSIALLVVVVIVLIDVIGRSFGHPLYGSVDISTMAFVIVVFGGMALCDQRGGHISVDLFERHYSRRLNLLIDIIVDFCGGVIFLTIAYSVIQSAKLSSLLNLRTNLLGLPQSWFQWLLAALALITALALLLRFAEVILSGKPHREKETAE